MNTLLMLTIALAATTTAATAQTTQSDALPSPPGEGRTVGGFDAIDTNEDGTISLAEWKAAGRREQGFKFMDADGDHKLTKEELMEGIKKFRNRSAKAAG